MPELTLYQFSQLDELSKTAILEKDGIYLEVCRFEGIFKIALFSLCSFYVEAWYHTERDVIAKFNPFSSYERLDLFLENLDVKSLLK